MVIHLPWTTIRLETKQWNASVLHNPKPLFPRSKIIPVWSQIARIIGPLTLFLLRVSRSRGCLIDKASGLIVASEVAFCLLNSFNDERRLVCFQTVPLWVEFVLRATLVYAFWVNGGQRELLFADLWGPAEFLRWTLICIGTLRSRADLWMLMLANGRSLNLPYPICSYLSKWFQFCPLGSCQRRSRSTPNVFFSPSSEFFVDWPLDPMSSAHCLLDWHPQIPTIYLLQLISSRSRSTKVFMNGL